MSDQAFGQEREAVVEAGRCDDHIVFTLGPVLEADGLALETCDFLTRRDSAKAQIIEKVGAIGRVAVEDLVVGFLRP